MIIGIIEGTYSTFISSFIVLEWTNMRDRQRKKRDIGRFGAHGLSKPIEHKTAMTLALSRAVPAAEDDGGEEEEAQEGPATGQRPPAPQATAAAPGGISAAAPGGISAAGPLPAPAPRTPGNLTTYPGQQGSRKNKKHKRRHH